jgi:hypothetical protein
VIGNLPKGVAMIGTCSAELQNKDIVKQCASSIVVVEYDFNNGSPQSSNGCETSVVLIEREPKGDHEKYS